MSDFDKEAEREKLREKYEREEEKRETTEQMSELLLKGATMTNAHCGDCGDPVFRYDGQEFCPTCQKPVDRGTDEGSTDEDAVADENAAGGAAGAADEGADAGGNGQSQGGIEVTSPSNDATVRFGGDANDEASTATDSATAEPDPAAADRTDSAPTGEDANRQRVPSADPSATRDERSSRPANADAPEPSGDVTRPAAGDDGSASDHLASAQVVLARTVEAFSRRAAATDDPRQASEYLEAARDAAETLDATRF